MQRPNWQVCGEVDNGLDAVEKAKSMSPDVAVLDLAMEGLNGVEAAAAIRANCPNTIVLTVSMYDAGPLFSELQIVGVRGFISKNLLVTELLPAIDAVLTGHNWFPMQAGYSRLGDSRQHGREPSSENRKGAAGSNGGRHV
jgi:DNA-binding NarL/FixJ family response regulator